MLLLNGLCALGSIFFCSFHQLLFCNQEGVSCPGSHLCAAGRARSGEGSPFPRTCPGKGPLFCPHEDPGSKEQWRLAAGREDPLPLGTELEAQFLHLSSRGRVRTVWDGVVKRVVVAARCTCPLPGPPWAALASSEIGPVIFFSSSVTQEKVEMKLGVSETELCGCFKMCLLRTHQGAVCAISGFSFFISFLSA